MYQTAAAAQSGPALPTDLMLRGPLKSRPAGSPPNSLPLPPALDGELHFVSGAGPRLALYISRLDAGSERGNLTPLVVVHSVNAAASAAEVRPVFERYGATRPVVALDLPGFGQSERGALKYSPQMMTEAILRAVEYLQGLGFKRPADLMAVSLSCEFAALAAVARPHWFRSVALVSPTGLDSAAVMGAYEPDQTKEKRMLRRVLEAPLWAQAVYRLLTSRASIRYFLGRTWGSVAIDQKLLEYNLLSVQQPGARYAPFAFVSGALFTPGIGKLYTRLQQPVWIAHGMRGDFSDCDGLPRLRAADKWRVDVFATGALPFFEVPSLFASRYDAFLRKARTQSDAARWRRRVAVGLLPVGAAGTHP